MNGKALKIFFMTVNIHAHACPTDYEYYIHIAPHPGLMSQEDNACAVRSLGGLIIARSQLYYNQCGIYCRKTISLAPVHAAELQ